MSRDDRILSMLAEAGVESAVRRPAEVIDLPLRSKFLANTAAKPEPEPITEPEPFPHTGWVRHLPKVGEYLGLACVVVGLLMVWSNVRETMILADVGRSTCSTLAVADTPEGQIYWLEPDPGSDVPKLKARMVAACYDAGKW